MKCRPRIEGFFALSLIVPVLLFLVGNVLDSEAWRRAAAYSMIPFLLLIGAAILASALSGVGRGSERALRRRRERIDAVLSTLGEGFCLRFTAADGMECAVRPAGARFVIKSGESREEIDRDTLVMRLLSGVKMIRVERERTQS